MLWNRSSPELFNDILSDGLQTFRHLGQRVRFVHERNVNEQTFSLGSVKGFVVDKVTEISPGILRHHSLQSNLLALLRHLLTELLQVEAGGELGLLTGC